MPDNFFTENQQHAIAVETTPGTPIALTGANVKFRHFKSSTPVTSDYKRFSNDQVSEDNATAPDFVSAKVLRIPFGYPLVTSGVVGTDPAATAYLEGLGLKKQTVKQITIGAPSGGDTMFKRGDTWTAPGGKAGIVATDISGAGAFKYISTAGSDLAAADVITSSGDTATASGTSTPFSVRFTPTSTAQKNVTFQRAIRNSAGTVNEDFLERIRGAMGTAVISANALDALRITGEYTGPQDFAGAGTFLTGVTYDVNNPPLFKNSDIQINGVLVGPQAVSFDLGNTISLLPEPTTLGGDAGFIATRIPKREPKWTIDPRRMKPSTLDDIGLLGSGAIFPVTWTIGTVAGNIIEISAFSCQMRENTEGEIEGLQSRNLSIFVTRNAIIDGEYYISFR
jgi:hypothetical protein